MAMVDLKGLYKVTAKGRTYWYAWRNGPRIAAAPGTDAFAAEFAAHHATRKGGDPAKLSGLIVDWKRSDAWTLTPEDGGLALSTRKNWKGPLDAITVEFGAVPVSAFEDTKGARRRIRTWLKRWQAQPRTADMHKQVLSSLLTYAVDEDRLTANPCFGIANAYYADRADIIWTEEDVAAFVKVASKELVWVLKLAMFTGLRRSDLLRLPWSSVNDLAIEVTASKSKVRGRRGRQAVIPMHADLKALLAEIPRRSPIVLTSSNGQPWGSGFSASWNRAMIAAKLNGKLHLHDARGTFATRIYLLRVFKLPELAEMLGWSQARVEKLIHRYVARDTLIKDHIRRLNEKRSEN